jgi:AcrR family transcriptional regulator
VKISQAQKLKNRSRLIESAVRLFSDQGFRNTTMRDIAKGAKLSEPAIYNYFPTKESIVYAFFEHELEGTLESLQGQKSLGQLGFCEQIQTLLEQHLERLQINRKFVDEAFKSIFITNLPSSSTEIGRQRELFVSFVQERLKESQRRGELHNTPFDRFFAEILWDFYIGVIYYWLRDSSSQSANTSQMIDKTLALLNELLKTNVLSKLLDLLQFFIRQHLFDGLNALLSFTQGTPDGQKKRFGH